MTASLRACEGCRFSEGSAAMALSGAAAVPRGTCNGVFTRGVDSWTIFSELQLISAELLCRPSDLRQVA
jgi:hypothetical protein